MQSGGQCKGLSDNMAIVDNGTGLIRAQSRLFKCMSWWYCSLSLASVCGFIPVSCYFYAFLDAWRTGGFAGERLMSHAVRRVHAQQAISDCFVFSLPHLTWMTC